MSFDKSVFINCPFDSSYDVMLHSMIFSIVSLGYIPRLSLESSDSGISRLDKIIDIIKQSKISIHDLSKVKQETTGMFSRMNMPFELGLDFACKRYAKVGNDLNNKKFLVIGGKKYDYMKALSDISGIDIQYHNNDVSKLIKAIRHWFVTNESLTNIPSPNEVWMKFMDFNAEFVLYTRSKGYDEKDMYEMPLFEQINHMKVYIKDNPYIN